MAGNALFRAMRLLMLIPFLGAMGYGLLMTKFTSEIQSGEAGFASDIVLKFGAAWLDNRIEKKRDAVIDITSLNDERRVTLSRRIAISALPGGADGPMSEARAEIAALAAAKQWGEAECAAMIKTFATACGFSTARAQISDNGQARIDVALSFAAATPVGETAGLQEASLVPQKVALTDTQGIEIPTESAPAERAKAYAAAEVACAALRKEKGTCAISNINFTETPADSGAIIFEASAEIAYLGHRTSAGALAAVATKQDAEGESFLSMAMKAMKGGTEGMTSGGPSGSDMPKPDEPPADAKTLLDNTELPSFKKTQGGAKFVSPP